MPRGPRLAATCGGYGQRVLRPRRPRSLASQSAPPGWRAPGFAPRPRHALVASARRAPASLWTWASAESPRQAARSSAARSSSSPYLTRLVDDHSLRSALRRARPFFARFSRPLAGSPRRSSRSPRRRVPLTVAPAASQLPLLAGAAASRSPHPSRSVGPHLRIAVACPRHATSLARLLRSDPYGLLCYATPSWAAPLAVPRPRAA